MISAKYRNIHPSFMGKIDINVSSNSDVGMSGSFTPFVPLYDRFYFNPEHEPCDAGLKLAQAEEEYFATHADVSRMEVPVEIHFKDIDEYVAYMEAHKDDFVGLDPEKIEIIEKDPSELPMNQKMAPEEEPVIEDTELDTEEGE